MAEDLNSFSIWGV